VGRKALRTKGQKRVKTKLKTNADPKLDLQRQRQVLEERVNKKLNRDGIKVVQLPDPLDVVVNSVNIDVQIRSLSYEAKVQALSRDALARIGRGIDIYTTCSGCGEKIDTKRLIAVPWVTLCIHCEENPEQQGSGERADPEFSLAAVLHGRV
jgi:RNA polymerase-binding transcription factor DksA